MPRHLRYRIGDTTVAVSSLDVPLEPERFDEYLPFLAATGSGSGDADLAIDVRLGTPALPTGARPLMAAGESWSAHERGGDLLIVAHVEPPAARPEWLAEVHAGRRRATLTSGETFLVGEGAARRLAAPFRYPLDQILLSMALAGKALIVHAAGVQIGGGGLLLAGPSGAGKTTIARICAAAGHAVLSDDRVIVSRSPAGWRMHGTPWPGEGRFAENRGVPLAGVAFLARGEANRLTPLAPAALARGLAPLATIPWFDREARDRCLDLLDALARAVPASEFAFRPEPGAAVTLAAEFAPLRR